MATRGRPRKAEEDRIIKRKIGMLPGQWRIIEEAAEIKGMSMTEYIRWVASGYAEKIVRENENSNAS
jgi:uncharacterized protein (DUF1778 family)